MTVLLALSTIAFFPATAFAHGALETATPGDGDQLSVAPRELRLTFSEDVELALTRLVLTGPSGAVTLAPLSLAPDSATVLVAAIQGSLVAGSYTVEWRMVGEDGHPTRGEYAFTIAPGAAGLAIEGPSASGSRTAATPMAPTIARTQPAQDSRESGSNVVLWIIGLIGLGVLGFVAFKLMTRAEADEKRV